MTVIMIFLNGERFIEEAIESVLRQEFQDWELILVDDGSAAPSASIARGYSERFAPFVRYVQHEGGTNRGMSASRNLGVLHAKGSFIAFIDADDAWAPGKLREQLAIMEAHPELGMVCGAVRYWSSWQEMPDTVVPTGHAQDRVVMPPEATLELYPLGAAAAPCPSDLLMRRDAVMLVGGFEEHFTGANQMYEDQGFLAKLYLSCPVYFSSRVWLNYRQHATSCVSEVTRGGRYHEVRRYFLNWFAGYLKARPEASHRVRVALATAQLPYTHPRLFQSLRFAWSTGSRAKKTAKRMAKKGSAMLRGC